VTPRPRVLLVLALVLAFGRTAHADKASPRQQALELFEESETRYRAGRFGEAAELLRSAYRLHPQPTLLYNLARALEGAGDFSGAIEAYQRYLREEKRVSDRGAIEAKIDTLRGKVEEHEALIRANTATIAAPAPAPAPDPSGSERLRETEGPPAAKPPSLLPWILAGSGVLAISAGSIVGGFALARHNDALSDPSQLRAAGLQNDSNNLSRVANLCFVGGAILVSSGALWWLLE
jgi:tetratricopeptide (TPR) repeat protein